MDKPISKEKSVYEVDQEDEIRNLKRQLAICRFLVLVLITIIACYSWAKA